MERNGTANADEIGRRLAAGETTARALAEAALAAIAEKADLGAFISHGAAPGAFIVHGEGVLDAADASDRRRAEGQTLGPLDGIPVAIKDNLAMAGTLTTGGHRAAGLTPDTEDAHVVARLKAAGAVIVGKTNLHEGALGATTDNPHHGRAINPLAAGHTPGGSSGGSAVAVAAGIVPIAIGSDTMGSVRIPASYCGLYGLKPGRGRIGRTGIAHLSPTLDVIGPLASTAHDLATTLRVLDAEDGRDPDWLPPAARTPALERRAGRLTVGIVACDDVALDAATREAFARARDAIGRFAEVREVRLAGWSPSAARRDGLLIIEAEAWALMAGAIEATPERFGAAFVEMVRYTERMKAERLARAYMNARTAGQAAITALASVDILMLPTTPQRSFAHDDPVPVDQADLTALANLSGLPAVALPVPAGDGGLPASVQLLGPMWSEYRLIELAHHLGHTLSRA
ncbi:amidase [Acuticoccus sp. M5D2P5]|uniref:amidase n=1 Tax=Acuticoccus kalidii TaxID=2910977 RepID=UPI001F4122AD|nr:amidase [Acuticoccus kalidii]MCF3932549.1 amidase [Acuticoccus kalidii]